MKPVRVLLIRHGETAGPKDILYSQREVPLSERGLSQSRKLVENLKELPLGAVYASDLSRAALPAKWLAQEAGLPLHLRRELREIDFGRWSGLSFSALLEIPAFRARLKNPAEIAPPGGETLVELKERALKAINEIKIRYPGQIVAVFTHGGLIRALLLHCLGSSLNNFFRLQQDYAAVNLVDFFPEGPLVRLVNGPCELNLKSLLERSALV